jgi:hypothetical protein
MLVHAGAGGPARADCRWRHVLVPSLPEGTNRRHHCQYHERHRARLTLQMDLAVEEVLDNAFFHDR